MLKKQSIRSNRKITLNGVELTKEEVIEISEEWNELKLNSFRKILSQGGTIGIKQGALTVKNR